MALGAAVETAVHIVNLTGFLFSPSDAQLSYQLPRDVSLALCSPCTQGQASVKIQPFLASVLLAGRLLSGVLREGNRIVQQGSACELLNHLSCFVISSSVYSKMSNGPEVY